MIAREARDASRRCHFAHTPLDARERRDDMIRMIRSVSPIFHAMPRPRASRLFIVPIASQPLFLAGRRSSSAHAAGRQPRTKMAAGRAYKQELQEGAHGHTGDIGRHVVDVADKRERAPMMPAPRHRAAAPSPRRAAGAASATRPRHRAHFSGRQVPAFSAPLNSTVPPALLPHTCKHSPLSPLEPVEAAHTGTIDADIAAADHRRSPYAATYMIS